MGHLSFLLTFIVFAWIVKSEGKYFFSGLPNSGTPSEFSLMNTTVKGSSFFYDKTFGIEGSWFAVILISTIAVGVFIIGRYYRKKTHTKFTV